MENIEKKEIRSFEIISRSFLTAPGPTDQRAKKRSEWHGMKRYIPFPISPFNLILGHSETRSRRQRPELLSGQVQKRMAIPEQHSIDIPNCISYTSLLKKRNNYPNRLLFLQIEEGEH
jgi:hypothetical protein